MAFINAGPERGAVPAPIKFTGSNLLRLPSLAVRQSSLTTPRQANYQGVVWTRWSDT